MTKVIGPMLSLQSRGSVGRTLTSRRTRGMNIIQMYPPKNKKRSPTAAANFADMVQRKAIWKVFTPSMAFYKYIVELTEPNRTPLNTWSGIVVNDTYMSFYWARIIWAIVISAPNKESWNSYSGDLDIYGKLIKLPYEVYLWSENNEGSYGNCETGEVLLCIAYMAATVGWELPNAAITSWDGQDIEDFVNSLY